MRKCVEYEIRTVLCKCMKQLSNLYKPTIASIYLFPVLYTRPPYRTILQTAYTQCSTDSSVYRTILQTAYMQCSTDSPVSVAFYRLAKHLYF